MSKVKIIKKNDEYSLEYNIGDICEVTGTWYGMVVCISQESLEYRYLWIRKSIWS